LVNGPALKDKGRVREVFQAAKGHWKQKVRRCPKRNAGGRASSRKEKARTIKLSDLPVAKARDASRVAESDEPTLCARRTRSPATLR